MKTVLCFNAMNCQASSNHPAYAGTEYYAKP